MQYKIHCMKPVSMITFYCKDGASFFCFGSGMAESSLALWLSLRNTYMLKQLHSLSSSDMHVLGL